MVDHTKITAQNEFEEQLHKGKKFKWMGQTVLGRTWLFGRTYFWMEDRDGVIYLIKETDGLPDFS